MIAISAARIVGQTQPASQSIAQLHLLDCAPPCWIGIIPGSTTVENAKTRIRTVYGTQNELRIKDSFVSDNYVGMDMEGDNFYLFVRLGIAKLVDAKSETVESIGLFESRNDSDNYAPSLADILAVFGSPRWIVVEELVGGTGNQITLKYDGLDVVFNVYTNRLYLIEPIPDSAIYFRRNNQGTLSEYYHRWKGIIIPTVTQ